MSGDRGDSARSVYRRTQLVALLAPSVGEDIASRTIDRAVAALGLDGTGMNREQAMRVLEFVAQEAGLVGIVARLAKSRLRADEMLAQRGPTRSGG